MSIISPLRSASSSNYVKVVRALGRGDFNVRVFLIIPGLLCEEKNKYFEFHKVLNNKIINVLLFCLVNCLKKVIFKKEVFEREEDKR